MSTITLNDVTIRTELRPGDLSYVAFMHGRIYNKEYDYGLTFESYVLLGLDEFIKQYNPANNRVWICEHDDRMIGFMLLMNRGKAAQLRYFIIEPEYRGIGLGKKLMDLYFEFLKECQYESTYLTTTDELPVAASLYKRHGFVLTEQSPSDAFGKPIIAQRYDLKLK